MKGKGKASRKLSPVNHGKRERNGRGGDEGRGLSPVNHKKTWRKGEEGREKSVEDYHQ